MVEQPAILAERDHERAEVREALGKLPEAQREAIVLAYWGGLTADQIARRARVPLGTARAGSGSVWLACATNSPSRCSTPTFCRQLR